MISYKYQFVLFSSAAIVGGLILSSLICALVAEKSPLLFFSCLFDGAFGTERRIWLLLLDAGSG